MSWFSRTKKNDRSYTEGLYIENARLIRENSELVRKVDLIELEFRNLKESAIKLIQVQNELAAAALKLKQENDLLKQALGTRVAGQVV